MQVTSEGSVRVDLVGGTLDLEPINLIIPNVVTLNLATSLKAKVSVSSRSDNKIIIESKDYNKTYEYSLDDFTEEKLYFSNHFEEMSFLCQIIYFFKPEAGLNFSLSSGAPAGSGLGGSSSMGVTLFKAMSKLLNLSYSIDETVKIVKSTEGRILNQGVPGYQDYYPALTGGVLCLRGDHHKITYKQLFSPELKKVLEQRITLVYSNISRNSGINNWDVYKGFFDKKEDVVKALNDIAKISFDAYQALENQEYEKFLILIGREGDKRKTLAAGIMPAEIHSLQEELSKRFSDVGMKMCGAGGGGCFLITHPKEAKEQINTIVQSHSMKVLPFEICEPLG